MPRKAKNSPPDIFNYVDCKSYLREWYAHKKTVERKFSYRKFAQQCSVAASLLNEIISGHHRLTVEVMHKCATAMELNAKQTEYFEALIHFGDSETNTKKTEWFERIAALRGRSPSRLLDKNQYEYFSKWYFPVIRELLTHVAPALNDDEIARMVTPPLTGAQVRKTKKLLKTLGLATEETDGRLRASARVIASEFQIQSVALKAFHMKQLSLAQEALDRFPPENREFETMTLSMSRTLYGHIKEKMRGFSQEVLNLVKDEQAPAEIVCQLGMQLFPFNKEMEKP